MGSRTVQSNDRIQQGGVASDRVQQGGVSRRLFATLMSIILVIGLMPTLTLSQQAYAADGDVASVTVGDATTTYADFSEALTAANAGTSSDPATLTLLADVDMGSVEGSLTGYVTFDLAGYTLTGDAYTMIEIGNQGQLTVEDTSAAGTGTITSTTCGAISISSGSLVVNSGTIKAPCVSFSDNGTPSRSVLEYAPVRTLYGTAVNSIAVTGGTVESMETYDEEDDVTVYGGEAIDITSYASGTTLEVTGGTVTGGSGWFGSRAVINVGNGNYTDPASTAPTVNITGGTITASDTSENALSLTAYANTAIGVQSAGNELDPRIAGVISSSATSSYGVYPNIYSGLYTQAPNASFIPSGYECIDYTEVEGYSYLVHQEAVEMYDVNVGNFSHGAITADPARAAAGDTVTLTVAPDTDYRLVSGSLQVAYTDASGTAQTITPDGSGTTYTFKMPAADVTVTAEFEVAPLWEGSGTEDDPYQIWTADDLNNLARKVNTGTTYSYTYFEVMDDITVDDGWIAIGYSSNYHFGGTFDGNLHVITLNASYTDDAAYRTHISETYDLSNGFYSTSYLGLFGYLYYSGTSSNIPMVKNVIVDGTLESYDTTYGMYVGGIAGDLSYGRIINCENCATISASGDSSGDYAGGITGYIQSNSTEVINVYNSGNVTAGQYGGYVNRAGGITGDLNPSGDRVINAVISEDCVITQNGEVCDPAGVARLFGYYDEDNPSYQNAYDRACINSGDISQSDLDNWNRMSLGYAPNVLDFWVLDDIQKPIPNADASPATVYKVNVVEAENGSIETDLSACAEGGTVKVTLTPDPGYEFESLTVTRDDGMGTVETTEGGANVYTFVMPASDVTVSATFTEATEFTVTFDSQGGSSVEPQTVAVGECAVQPADPTRDGYTFTGWYADEACTEAFDFSTPIMSNIILYAGWKSDSQAIYTVTFDSQGGSSVASQSVAEGECATPPADPTRTNYTFTGWYTDAACTTAFDFATPITGDITLYAGWQLASSANTVTVTFDTNGGTQVDPQFVVKGECAVQPADPEKEGYEFIGWYSDEACTQLFDFSIPIEESTIIYAGWVSVEYYITIVNSEGGTITASPMIADAGDKIEITVVVAEGYTLATLRFFDADTGEDITSLCNPVQTAEGTWTFTMPAENVIITPVWEEEPAPEPEKTTITSDMFEVDTTYGIYDGTDPVTKTVSSDLVEGVDYTVTYANNTSAGTATITITGIGDYEGTLTYTFKVIHYFEDVGATVNDGNEWYFDAVYGMVDLGAITGYTETIFGVGDSMSRAQLVTIMWRYCEPEEYANYDEKNAKDTTGLPDAQDGTYYTGAVNWAYANGVITGNQHSDGTYTLNPDDPVTFDQMVTILARYCLGSFDAAANYPQTALNSGNFTDKDAVEGWAAGSMSWAIENELVTGNNNGDGTYTLSPLENVARERATTVLYRTINTGLLVVE